MLVLSRKSNESLVIGDDIQVKVLSINGNRVKLGIEAPHECRIIRAELAEELADTAGGGNSSSTESWLDEMVLSAA